MIYNDTLCALKEDLMATGYFSHLFEFAVMEEQGDVKKPVYYADGGQVRDVMAFDQNGSGYIRKNGRISISRSPMQVPTSCDAKTGYIDLRLPLKGVFAVPKSKLGNDAFSTDKLAIDLMAVLHADMSANAGLSAVGRVLGYETERNTIYNGETNTGTPPILELAYLSIDFEITFTGAASCFQESCAYY